MSLEIGCIAYAAFANLALTKSKYRAPEARNRSWSPAARRLFGIAFFALSLGAAIWRFGPFQGPVVWLGMLSIAALVLVLLLSRWPATALRLWAPAAFISLLLLFM